MATISPKKRICLIPNVSGVGGMVSFRDKLVDGLADPKISVSTNLADTPYSAVLVIGGTRDLPGLLSCKKHGIRIVQRLDGMNWIHRKRRTGLRHFLRAEYGNLILSLIRRKLACQIVYQSHFSRKWWERVHGIDNVPSLVVYNGVDLNHFTPIGPGIPPDHHLRILIVEGSIGGGYEWGLETAIQLAEILDKKYQLPIEIMVVGRIGAALQQAWKGRVKIQIIFTGQVPAGNIPELDRSAHLLYAADINAACPNSVIEAIACGLPVVAFDTGALSELLDEGAGKIVPYGGDPWRLDQPDIDGLAQATLMILNDLESYRTNARRKAESAFGLDQMVEGYLGALNL